ncbi:hypothetical protein GQR58_009128 [Nymphon striatum]|nr:hypothetical protein GQR58_009128 [Nymphon striatum]
MVVKNRFIDDISPLVALVVKLKFVRKHSIKFGRNKFKWNTVPLYLKRGIDQLLSIFTFVSVSVFYRSRFITGIGVSVDDNHLFEVVVDSRSDSYRAGIGVSVDDNHLFEVVVDSRSDSYRSRFIQVSSPNAEMVVKNKFIDDISPLVALKGIDQLLSIFTFVSASVVYRSRFIAGIGVSVDDNHLFEVVVDSRSDSYRSRFIQVSSPNAEMVVKNKFIDDISPLNLPVRIGPRINHHPQKGDYRQLTHLSQLLTINLKGIDQFLSIFTFVSASVVYRSRFIAGIGVSVDDNHLFEVVVDSRSDSYRAGIGVSVDDNHLFEVVVDSRSDSYRSRFIQVSSPNAEMVVKNKFIDDISPLVALKGIDQLLSIFTFVSASVVYRSRFIAGIGVSVDDNHLFEVVVDSRSDSYRSRFIQVSSPNAEMVVKNKFIDDISPLKGIDQLLSIFTFVSASVVYRSRFIAGIGVSVDDNHLFEVVVDSRSDSYRNKFKWNTVLLYLKKGIDQLLSIFTFVSASVVYRSRFIAGIGVSVDDNHLFEVVVDSRSDSYRSRFIQVSSPTAEMVVKNKFIDDISPLVALVDNNFKFVLQHSMKFLRNKFKWNTVPLYLKRGIDQLLSIFTFVSVSVVYSSRFITGIGVSVDDNHLFEVVVDSRSDSYRSRFIQVSSPTAEMVVKNKFIDDISPLVALVDNNF